MILNKFIVTYLLFSAISLILGMAALIVAWWVKRTWWIGQSAEEQSEVEKRLYLIISLIGLGFVFRLVLVPLWFVSLQSMIPSVPGAMCLFGVHQISTPVSWAATGFKILLPFFYGFWLVLDRLDRKVESRPFLETKLTFLFPFGLMMIVESALDLKLLFTVPPRQVSCCTSFFDAPSGTIPQVIDRFGAVWVEVWYLLIFLIIGSGIINFLYQKKGRPAWARILVEARPFIGIQALIIIGALLSFFLALHTKISPLFLHLPFHHCIFCLWQDVWDAPVFTGLILIGLCLFATCLGVSFLKEYKRVRHELGTGMMGLMRWAVTCLVTGTAVLTLHLILA